MKKIFIRTLILILIAFSILGVISHIYKISPDEAKNFKEVTAVSTGYKITSKKRVYYNKKSITGKTKKKVRYKYKYRSSLEYTVNGKTYPAFINSQIPEGNTIVIYYNTKKPSQYSTSPLNTTNTNNKSIFSLILSVFFKFIVFICFFVFLKNSKSIINRIKRTE